MDGLYKLKKGLDLNLKGKAEPTLGALPLSKEYAICPGGFNGIHLHPLVKEGEHVLAGQAVLSDKQTGLVKITSPVSGTISSIERGERRKLLGIHIQADAEQANKDYGHTDLTQATAESIKNLLLESGLFAYVRQRPYDIVASPNTSPKGIFISAFSKMPLAADFSFVVKGQDDLFKTGVNALAKLAKVYIGISPEQEGGTFIPKGENIEVNVFDGPNPSGNVGVQINHVAPINKGEVAWTIGAEVVIMIGRLIESGIVDQTRRIAVAGSKISKPAYISAKVGTPIKDILAGRLSAEEHSRIINGNPLVGELSGIDDYLHPFTTEICAIPEGDNVNEVLGWITPRLKDFSTSHSYFSWLFGKKRTYDLDCRIKGGERHMIMSNEYERVFPMDILPSYLVKAIITGDIDKQEELGIYEVAPEDFAVAEFVDSSKLELQRIVRQGLDILQKENA